MGAAKPPRVGGGRGSYLLSMLPSNPELDTPLPAASTHSSSSTQSMYPSTTQATTKARPSGRGAALLEMCG